MIISLSPSPKSLFNDNSFDAGSGKISPMLALKNVTKTYGRTKVLSGASVQIAPKDCVCIVGEGGSGKTTLLKLLARIEDPTSGNVEIDGIPLFSVPPAILQLYRRRTGIIFQEPVLLTHASVDENVSLPLDLFSAPQKIRQRNTDDLLKRMGLTAKANMLAGELSFSERMLVGIARAIITAPMVIIADEPFLPLDDHQRSIAIELLKNLHKKGTTIIVLSRDHATARLLNARTLLLKDGKITTDSGRQTAQSSTVSKAQTHKILEETESRIHSIIDQAPAAAAPKGPKKGPGNKIRITSIGSGL